MKLPLDPSESVDTDSDGIGNNADAFPFDPSQQTDSDGDSSLHFAAWKSDKGVQMLQFLIDNYNGNIKEIINQKNNGWTPLDYAYEYNKSPIKNDIVSLLRKYGGKANYYDKNGNKVGKGKGDLND